MATVLVQVVPVFRGVGFHYTPAVDLHDREARRTLILLWAAGLGLAGSQLTLLFLTMLGSTLAAGAIGAFALAFTIFQIPLGTIAYPSDRRAPVALPARRSRRDRRVRGARDPRSRLLGFAMLPLACIAAGVCTAGHRPRCRLRARRRGRDRSHRRGIPRPPAALPSEAAIIVLSRAFFAARNTWIPVAAALVSVVVAVGTALALLVAPLGLLGLALGLTVASWVEAALLLAAFRSRHARFGLLRLGRAHLWYLAAAIVAGFAADRAYDVFGGSLGSDPGVLPAALALAGAGLVGLGVYVGLAAVLRIPELGVTVRLVRSGLGRGVA